MRRRICGRHWISCPNITLGEAQILNYLGLIHGVDMDYPALMNGYYHDPAGDRARP